MVIGKITSLMHKKGKTIISFYGKLFLSGIHFFFLINLSCASDFESNMGDKLEFTPELIMQIAHPNLQGAACYNNYLFQFTSQNSAASGGGIVISELTNKQVVDYIDLGYNENYHNSHASFSSFFYDEHDLFPLLFVSENKEQYFEILIYRILYNNQSFSAELVNQLIIPEFLQAEALLYPHAVINYQSNELWIEGYSKDLAFNVFYKFGVFFFSSYKKKEVVTSEAKESFQVLRTGNTDQSFLVHGKHIFQISGLERDGYFRVIDKGEHCVIKNYYLPNSNLYSEPEGIFIWDNTICISFINGNVYKVLPLSLIQEKEK